MHFDAGTMRSILFQLNHFLAYVALAARFELTQKATSGTTCPPLHATRRTGRVSLG